MKNYLFILAIALVTLSNAFSQTASHVPVFREDSSQDSLSLLKATVKNTPAANTELKGSAAEIIFNEHPFNHNMHIASDGNYYYTINGGNITNGQINKFSLSGTLIQTYPIQIDGRGLSYNQADGFLYASLFGRNIVKITELATGSYTTKFTSVMQNDQASFAISKDGTKFYDFFEGTLKIHDFNTGAVIGTISGLSFGSGNYGGNAAVAVDLNYIYTWNATTRMVYIYDMLGVLKRSVILDNGDNGHSLSIANGLLFVSVDGNYGVGTWYGTSISSLLPLKLISFSAKVENKIVVTKWETANELNTSHFVIQRSIDGSNFVDAGRVEAKVNANNATYQFKDAGATMLNKDILYYRLLSMDKDESRSFSKVVSVTLQPANYIFSIFPNPVKDVLYAKLSNDKAELVTIRINDMQGKLLKQQKMQLVDGVTNFNIDIAVLAKGMYVMKIKGKKNQHKTFFKN